MGILTPTEPHAVDWLLLANLPLPRKSERTNSVHEIDAADILLEHAGTVHRDFSYSQYNPTNLKPTRFHSGTMLRHLLRQAGCLDAIAPVLASLRGHLGEDETIWGVKWMSGEIVSFEFYISNRDEPAPVRLRSFVALKAALYPWLEDFLPPWERCPYTMVSFEVGSEGAKHQRAENVHIYLSSHMRVVGPDGYSYELERDAYRLRNHYRHYTLNDLDELRGRILLSPHLPMETDVETVLPPHRYGCRSVSYAAKQTSDGVYFRRLPISNAIQFAETFGLDAIKGVLREHELEFEHLCWDVGLDFGRTPTEQHHGLIRKLAIYGLW